MLALPIMWNLEIVKATPDERYIIHPINEEYFGIRDFRTLKGLTHQGIVKHAIK